MLRKAMNLSEVPYKSGCTCSETEGRPAPFCPFRPRLSGNAPKSRAAAGLARAFFYKVFTVFGWLYYEKITGF